MATITIPAFDFSGIYYPQILEALIQWKRRDVPELTDESPEEPFIQLLRAFALVGHLNNVLADMIANESTLPTAQLVETVRNMLRLIDYEMASASPAQADQIYELSTVIISDDTEIVPVGARAETKATTTTTSISFEALEQLLVDRTDRLSFVLEEDESSNTFVDHTANANDETGGTEFEPLPATPAVKDAVYFGHKHVMFNTLQVEISSAATNIFGVWEYYDGEARQVKPDSVTDLGNGTLRLNINGLLGSNEKTGTRVRAQLNETTAFESVESQWDGTNYIITTILGQTAISTDVEDYTVGSEWHELTISNDEVQNFTNSGVVEFSLPQTLTQNWRTAQTVYSDTPTRILDDIDGGFFIRYRVVSVAGSPSGPELSFVKMDEGKQYVHRSVTQGRTADQDPLGSSDGSKNQTFDSNNENFIDGSETLYVDEQEWSRVGNFLSSLSTDKHYRVQLGDNDRATFIFGDGVSGAIPPVGTANIRVEYRHSANLDGNVGANTIKSDASGLSFVAKLYNPRPATGWREAEGASTASLEQAKIEGPASLRVREVAIGPGDVETVTRNFEDANGSRPFARSKAIEEGFGPKTIENVVVGAGGGQATSDQLDDLDTYFNGDPTTVPPSDKHITANQEVTSVNFTPHPLTIEANVTVEGEITASQIKNQLLLVFQPTSLKENNVDYEWDYGEDIPASRISHEIFASADDIQNTQVLKVDMVSPATGTDVVMLARELPTLDLGDITINIVE